MITPYVVFWALWLFGVFVALFAYPFGPANYRPLGFAAWIWVMLGLLGLIAGGSPFKGW